MSVTMDDFYPQFEVSLEDFYPNGSDAFLNRAPNHHPAAALPSHIAPAFLRILEGIRAGADAEMELLKIARFCDWQLKSLGARIK